LARTATPVVMDQHALALARLVRGDGRPDLLNDAARLMTAHDVAPQAALSWRQEVGSHVAAAHARRPDGDDHLTRPRLWIGNVLENDLAIALEHHAAHQPLSLSGSGGGGRSDRRCA